MAENGSNKKPSNAATAIITSIRRCAEPLLEATRTRVQTFASRPSVAPAAAFVVVTWLLRRRRVRVAEVCFSPMSFVVRARACFFPHLNFGLPVAHCLLPAASVTTG